MENFIKIQANNWESIDLNNLLFFLWFLENFEINRGLKVLHELAIQSSTSDVTFIVFPFDVFSPFGEILDFFNSNHFDIFRLLFSIAHTVVKVFKVFVLYANHLMALDCTDELFLFVLFVDLMSDCGFEIVRHLAIRNFLYCGLKWTRNDVVVSFLRNLLVRVYDEVFH